MIISIINNIICYFQNIQIYFLTNTIDNLSSLSICKNVNDNIIFYNILKENDKSFFHSFRFMKYIYFFIGTFLPLKFIFINYIPNDIVDIISFFNNTNISFEIITNKDKEIVNIFKNHKPIKISYFDNNNESILTVFIKNYRNMLTNEQINYYEKIAYFSSNNEIENKKYFHLGYNLYPNMKKVDEIWNISYESDLVIDLFIKDGKKIYC